MDAKSLNEFEDAHRAAMAEQEVIAKLQAAIEQKLRLTINEHFPDEINYLSAEGYRELEKIVADFSGRVALRVNEVFADS